MTQKRRRDYNVSQTQAEHEAHVNSFKVWISSGNLNLTQFNLNYKK